MTTVLASSDFHYQSNEPMGMLVEWILNHVQPGGHHFFVDTGSVQAQLVAMIVVSILTIFLFGVIYKKKQKVPTGVTNFLEVFVVFVRNDICIANIGEKDGKKWAPLFCTFFFFVLGCNLLGLVPGAVAATGNVNVTAGLATMVLLMMTVGVIVINGPKKWFAAFVPHGVPLPVLFLITPLEMMGLLIKTFALTVRLFANMLAGHIVLFALIGLLFAFPVYFSFPAAPIGLAIYGLEVFVAFLQAYIFTYLSAMFFGQVLHPAH
jgi:F-type H+-transporting ATPase subunit a